jgi:hypothetical protein
VPDNEPTEEIEGAQRTGDGVGRKNPWRAYLITIGAVATGLVTFKHDVADLLEPITSLFRKEPITLNLTQASAQEMNIFGVESTLAMKFTVERKGQEDKTLSCFGEGYRDNVNMTDAGQHFKSVKLGQIDYISIVGGGNQSFTLLLAPESATDLPAPRVVNFRINCSKQVSPWMPVEVTMQPPPNDNPFRDPPRDRRH